MRKIAWAWLILAFVAGLAGGLGVAWWVRSGAVTSRQALLKRNSELHGETQVLATRLNSAEGTISVLKARLEQNAVASSAVATSSSGGGASGCTPSGPPKITERAVSPQQVKSGAQLTLTVKLTGHASRVNMRVAGPGGFDKTYFLGRESFNGSGEVWGKTIEAPSSAGVYRYYAIAYDANGVKYPMPGVSGWSFEVQ